MSNTSATGGYLTPTSSSGLPGGITLVQFLQTFLVGVSGLDPKLVRPKWQLNPPKQPDVDVNWLAFNVLTSTPDANSYVDIDEHGVVRSQRQNLLELTCAFYGPQCEDIMSLTVDGFWVPQNLEALRLANISFKGVSQGIRVPDFVNERWVDRMEMSILLNQQSQRVYPILPILSASGKIHTVLGNEEYLIDWSAN